MGVPQDIAKGLDLFRTLVFDTAVDAAMTAYLPGVIAIPIIGPLVKMLINGFSDALYKQLGGMIVFGSVLFVDLAHRKAFDSASTSLQQIAIDKGIDSPEFKVAHEKEKQALKKFGQFNIVQPGLTGK